MNGGKKWKKKLIEKKEEKGKDWRIEINERKRKW